jgi:hypothetical protein
LSNSSSTIQLSLKKVVLRGMAPSKPLETTPTVEDDGRAGAVVNGGIGGGEGERGRYDVAVIAQLLVPLQRRHLDTTLTPIQRIIC